MDHRYEVRTNRVKGVGGLRLVTVERIPKTPRTLLEHVDEWGHQTSRTWLTWPLCDLLEVRYLRDFLPHPWRYVARERLTHLASMLRLQG